MNKKKTLLNTLVMSLLCLYGNDTKHNNKHKMKAIYNKDDIMLNVQYNEQCYNESSYYFAKNTDWNYVKNGNTNLGQFRTFTNALKFNQSFDQFYDYYFLLTNVEYRPLGSWITVGVPTEIETKLILNQHKKDEKILGVEETHLINYKKGYIDFNSTYLEAVFSLTSFRNEITHIYKNFDYNSLQETTDKQKIEKIDPCNFINIINTGEINSLYYSTKYFFNFGNNKPNGNGAITCNYEFYSVFPVKLLKNNRFNITLKTSIKINDVNKSWPCNWWFVSNYSNSSELNFTNN